MTDLIDRQMVMEVLNAIYINRPLDSDRWVIGDITNQIKDLPSAEPERKTGKWIIRDNPGTGWYRITCSECGEDVTATAPCIGFYPNARVTWNYCPECGARMDAE